MENRIRDDRITLDYGSGGLKTSELIESILLPAFDNTALSQLGDGAILNGSDKLVFSTDSFVVSPWRFPGGDIGKLSVCGTVNDLCMAGGTPKYLSLSFILEEGFSFSDFKDIVSSIAEEAKKAGVSIVTGDTKSRRFRQRRRDLYQHCRNRFSESRPARKNCHPPGRCRSDQRHHRPPRRCSHDGTLRTASRRQPARLRLPAAAQNQCGRS